MSGTPPYRVIARGRFIQFCEQDGWEFIDQFGLSGVVVIVAVTDTGCAVLVEQFRIPLGARTIEWPAGLVGDKAGAEAEPLECAAARELEEETGFSADRFERIAEVPASPARSTLRYTFFRARGLQRVHEGGGDEQEDITVHVVPIADIDNWLAARERDGLVVDSKVYTGLYFIERERKRV